MRVLRVGMSGPDVSSWQTFLKDHVAGRSTLQVDGSFGPATLAATLDFQRSVPGLQIDGAVGPLTRRAALSAHETSVQMSEQLRAELFGTFTYEAAPSKSNPEGIRITDSWASDNIVVVNVPQLVGVDGAAKGGAVLCHRLAAPKLVELFARWEAEGLKDRVLSWAGMWAPRFIRGSRTVLSNHAWGTAFDINTAWNVMGTSGAAQGLLGSVVDLIPIAERLGWYSGSRFVKRPDPMHFELARL